MKKLIALVLCLALTLSMASCGQQAAKEPETSKETDAKTDLFEYEQVDASIVLTKYIGTEEVVYIPDEIDGIPVTEIGESCFAGDVHMKKVHVPEGVIFIDDYAFECCSILEKVYLPESLTVIGDGAFSGCGSIKMIDIQDQVEEIGDGAFLFCRKLISFIAPASLKKLGDFAFAGCRYLYVADLSQSQLTTIPGRAFYGNTRLFNVTLPETLTEFGVRAFALCPRIESIYFPDSVNHISSYAFESCENLNSVDLRGGDVDAFAFDFCYGIKSVNFSDAPITLHKDAFAYTEVWEDELYIPENVTIEDGAFPVREQPHEAIDEEYTEEYVEEEAEASVEEVDEEDAEASVEEVDEDESEVSVDEAEDSDMPDLSEMKTDAEILAAAAQAGYRVVPNDEFDTWADEYLEYNKETADYERNNNVYTDNYKRQIEGYYTAMTAAATKNPSDIAVAVDEHGEDFMPMYEMANHGLHTEMKRFRMPEDMLLVTGVYDSQLMAAAGTDTVPTMDELKSLIGTTFCDPCLTSTTNDIHVAVGFSDTMFVIYAPAESLDALGTVAMDAYMRTYEKETLLFSGAEYEILDVGCFSYEIEDELTGEKEPAYEKYVLVKLINQ